MTFEDLDEIAELFPWLLPAFEEPTSVLDTPFN